MGNLQSVFGGTAQGAFVFIKPHANTPQVQELVKTKFAEVGISVISEGEITGEQIDSTGYIDQHYYAIASKATIMKPAELNVPLDKFTDAFGEDWKTVMAEDRAFNAMDVQAKLGIDADALDALWNKAKDEKRLVKFGGGFYCTVIDQAKKIYTFKCMSGFRFAHTSSADCRDACAVVAPHAAHQTSRWSSPATAVPFS